VRETRPLILAMALAIAFVAALAYWDEQRESAAALADFADEQATMAAAVAAGMAGAPPGSTKEEMLSHAARLAAPGSATLLLSSGDPPRLVGVDGNVVDSPAIALAVASGARSARLSRPEAAALGLPERTAIAGLARVPGEKGTSTVAVVTTARRERDREKRAEARLVLGVLLGAALVVAFGSAALRRQRQKLELARELAVGEVARDRDAQLVRADKMATLGAMATGIAHEVATPLGVIVGRAEQLAARAGEDPRAARAAKDVLEQAERIDRVMRGFLTLARGDAPELERRRPEDVARNAARLVEHRFAQAGVTLDVSVEDALPDIACEPRLFEHALVNLLLNACDACAGGGRVVLSAFAREGRVAFVVVDDGEGIAAEVAARATEPFFTTKPTGKGTGLGLAIANEIAKHHRGAFALAPRGNGKGTEARIEIPAAHEER
jgi:signal transduction histidine kinase